MKITSFTLVTLALLLATTLTPAAQPKGERATVKGEVVDMWCYLEGGDRGPAKRECATACAKAGNAIGIVDVKGNLFVAAGLKDHQPAQALLIVRMNSDVTVSGTVVKKGGVQMIYIDSVQ
jgi:type 1 fimbria pilin